MSSDLSIHASVLPGGGPADGSPFAICAVRIAASATAAAAPRTPFHLALVVDVSGSMKGARLQSVQATLQHLIELLGAIDRLSLVVFSNEAELRINALPMADAAARTAAHRIVTTLVADGGTNLAAGLLELGGLAAAPDAVVLLTDGHCNMGSRSPSGLAYLATHTCPDTAFHTIGYGADHDQAVLRALAVETCGSYAFASVDELIPTIVGDIVGSLATRVARNVCVSVSDGWTPLDGGRIGDAIADRPHTCIFVAETAAAAATLPTVTVQWTPVGTAVAADPITLTIVADTVSLTPEDIAEQYARVTCAGVFGKVADAIAVGNVADARGQLQDLIRCLESSKAVGRPLHSHLMAQVLDRTAELEKLEQEVSDPSGATDPFATPRRRSRVSGASHAVSRLVSGEATLRLQRGVQSLDPSNNVFSSPTQRHTSQVLHELATQTPVQDW